MKLKLLIGSFNLTAINAHGPGIGGPNGLGTPEGPPPFGRKCKSGQHDCPVNSTCIDTEPSGFICECNEGKRSKIKTKQTLNVFKEVLS